MLDNSQLSIGTIKILNDFNITTLEELKSATLPKVGDKSHVYASKSFRLRHLVEITEYLNKLKIEPYLGKVIKVTSDKFMGEYLYNVIGFDDDNDVILKGTYYPKSEPFTVDKLWFDQELTGRKIEIIKKLT